MKKLFGILATLATIGTNSYAAQVLTCWDKYDPSNHKPAVTATIDSDSLLRDINFGVYESNIDGPVAGKINPRARKYAGWYQFPWNWKNGEGYSVLSLPPNVTQVPGYFYASIQSVTTGGGGVMHLNCRVK